MLENSMYYLLWFLIVAGSFTRHWFPTGLIMIVAIIYILLGHYLFFGDSCA